MERPLACVMDAIPASERPAHAALMAQLFGAAVQERTDMPGGYAFRFAADEYENVVRFVLNERRCCPFLRFEIDVAAHAGPVRLRLTGPAGTREFLEAELGTPDPAAPGRGLRR